MGAVKVIIGDPDTQFTQEVSAEFKGVKDIEIVASTTDWKKLPDLTRQYSPACVIFGPGWGNERVLTVWLNLKQDHNVQAIYLTTDLNPQLKNKANEFKSVLAVPVDPQELIKLVRLVGKERSQKSQEESQFNSSLAEKTNYKGKVITIFSPKGGVGKTVLATNLAVSLAMQTKQQIGLIDVDLQFGDISVMLKLKPAYTIADLANSSNIDKEKLFSVLVNYQDLVRVLAAPLQPEQADLITPDLLAASVGLLKSSFPYVIVDTQPTFNDQVLTIIDHTDLLLLVATLDLPCLKNIKLCLNTLKLLGFPAERIKIVLNRVESGLGIDQLDVQKVFQQEILAEIANDTAVTLAVNQGRPVVLAMPKATASQQIMRDVVKKLKSFLEEGFICSNLVLSS